MSLFFRGVFIVTVVSLLGAAPWACGQDTWTGAENDYWGNPANWNPSIPGVADTARFVDSGNGNTTITLGGGDQSIGAIVFDGNPTPYTLGVLGFNDEFHFDHGGAITVTNTVTAPQTINADIRADGPLTITNSGSGGLAVGGTTMLFNQTLTINSPGPNNTRR